MDGRQQLWGNRVRGLVLGLTLGDTVGGGPTLPETGTLRVGVASQLAAFTLEGLIRALVRADHKGICHPPSVLWHAYCRWAHLQGVAADIGAGWADGTTGTWPDGWLATVPVLAERRGSAPAAVTALQSGAPGTPDRPATSSAGSHAVTRTLPLAPYGMHGNTYLPELVRDVAALTHGHTDAHEAAVAATQVAGQCLVAGSLREAIQGAFAVDSPSPAVGAFMSIDHAQQVAGDHPADPAWLAKVAPNRTANSALAGGIYVAASFPRRDQVLDAVTFAAGAADGRAVAATTGAFLGALHGADALPVGLLSRLELTWVLDTLARDLATQLHDRPSGTEYTTGPDPHWWDRYPGW